MKERVRNALKNPLISGSVIIFLGSNFGNLFNFLFNIFIIRNLSAADYGAFASLMSLAMLVTIPSGAVAPTILRFAASYFATSDFGRVRGLYLKISKQSFIIGVVIFLSFIFFRNNISHFLNIANPAFVVQAGFTLFLTFIGVANYPLLQAKLAFSFIAFSNFITSVLKFALGIVLVYLGFAVWGALWAIFLSTLVPFLLSFFQLKFLFNRDIKTPEIDFKELVSYGIPAAIALFGFTSLISTDVLLVKHFFPPNLAGSYAVISLLARIIYFLTGPIASVMFPLIVQKHTRNENYHADFKLAFLMVLIPSVFLNIGYFLFPEFIITVASKKEYVFASPILGIFGLFLTAYSLLAILINFYISIKKTDVYIPIAFAAVLQAVLLWIYHPTFFHVVLISLIITTLLLIWLLLYYWQLYVKK